MKAVEGDSQGMLLQLMLLVIAPHACQQCNRLLMLLAFSQTSSTLQLSVRQQQRSVGVVGLSCERPTDQWDGPTSGLNLIYDKSNKDEGDTTHARVQTIIRLNAKIYVVFTNI